MCSRKVSACIGTLAALALAASAIGWSVSNDTVGPDRYGFYQQRSQRSLNNQKLNESFAAAARRRLEQQQQPGDTASKAQSVGQPAGGELFVGSPSYLRPAQPLSPRADSAGFGVRVDCNTNGTDDTTEIAGIILQDTTDLVIDAGNSVSDDFNNAFPPAILRVSCDDLVTTSPNFKFNRINLRAVALGTQSADWIIKIWSNNPTGFAPPPAAVPACAATGDPGDGSLFPDNPGSVIYQETINGTRTVITDPPLLADGLNYEFNLATTVNLATAGRYWVEIYHNQPADDQTWGMVASDNLDDPRAFSNIRRSHSAPTGPAPCNVAEIWSRATDNTYRWSFALGTVDRNGNGVPDVCDDCNTNGTPDQSEAYTDCDTNSNPDECDLVNGNSTDCNTDLIPDECGQDCNTSETHDLCELVANDCNTSLTPDECELFRNRLEYIIDDGTADTSLGITGIAPPFFWMNQMTIGPNPGDNEIHFIEMSWGTIDENTNARLLLVSDPNGDGSPVDGELIYSQVVQPANNNTDIIKSYAIPDIIVGNAGDNFFVGCYVRGGTASFPMNIDQTASLSRTWVKINQAPIQPDAVFLSDFAGSQVIDVFATNFAGNAVIRAVAGDDEDCNNDTTPDDCQLSGNDCDTNGTPDECDPDCNGNFNTDACDIAAMTSADTNTNVIPDECEDCDSNTTPDTLQGNYADCNTNDKHDRCEIFPLSGDLQDCNSNFIPDICETDCNTNGLFDLCDLGVVDADCNSNNVPDQCEDSIDCNTDGTPDPCQPGGSADCNTNGTVDLCDRLYGFTVGTPDGASNGTLSNLFNGITCFSFLSGGVADGPMVAEDFDISKGGAVITSAEIEVIACKQGDPPGSVTEALTGFNDKLVVSLYRSIGSPPNQRPAVDADFSATVTGSETQVIGFPGTPAVFDVWRYSTIQNPNLRISKNGKWWVSVQPQTTDSEGFAFISESEDPNFPPDITVSGSAGHWRPGLNVSWIPSEASTTINLTAPVGVGYAMSISVRDDCNTNLTLDECEAGFTDNNTNGVRDLPCEDCNTNNIRDFTEGLADCNSNEYPDICDLRFGWFIDCNSNGRPDVCDTDCDNDGTPDACQIIGNDCNTNNTLDPCEALPDISTNWNHTNNYAGRVQLKDCNTNLTLDVCESLANCNTNGTPDVCDISPINRVYRNIGTIPGAPAGTPDHPGLDFANGFLQFTISDEEVTGTNGQPFDDNTQVLADDYHWRINLPWSGLTFYGGFFDIFIGEDSCTDVHLLGSPAPADDAFDVVWYSNFSATVFQPLNNDLNSNGLVDDDFMRTCTAAAGQVQRVPTVNGTQFYLKFPTPITLPGITGSARRWLEYYYTGPSGAPNGSDFATGLSIGTTHLAEFKYGIEVPVANWRQSFNPDDKICWNYLIKAGPVLDADMNGTPDECAPACTTCQGDVNGDNRVDGQDVHCYVRCLIQGGGFTATALCPASPGCACANMTLANFVNKLLTDATVACP